MLTIIVENDSPPEGTVLGRSSDFGFGMGRKLSESTALTVDKYLIVCALFWALIGLRDGARFSRFMPSFAQIAASTSRWPRKARKLKGVADLIRQKKLSPAKAGLGGNSF